MQKFKLDLIINIVILWLVLFIGIILIEGILRLSVKTEYHFWEPDSNFEYTFIKNLSTADVVIDSQGFRSRQFDYSAGTNTKRVMVLGDSVTANMAVPTDKMFTYILSQRLNNNSPYEWEVLNRGIEGWGTDNEYIYYVKSGYKYNPDIVVLEFSLNDFSDNFLKNMVFVKNKSLMIKDKFPPFSYTQRIKLYLNGRSALYRLIAESYQKMFDNPASRKIFYFSGPSVELDKAFNLTTLLAKDLKKQVSNNGGRFVVVIVPDARVVNKDHYVFWNNIHGTYVPQPELMKEIIMFRKYLERNNIDYVDTSSYINDLDDYISFSDGHLSASGSKKISDLIYNKLQRLGWLTGNFSQ